MPQYRRNFYAAAAALVAAATAGLAPVGASASSFQIQEQSPKLLGKAFSGTASSALGAATVFYNPAGMTQLDERTLALGGTLISARAEFEAGPGTNVPGDEGETDELGFVPVAYYVHPLNERWRLGFGLNAPFGLTTAFEDDWVGRYFATYSELRLINFNVALAYAVTDRLSLAAGVDFQYIEATLVQEVDSFAACVGGANAFLAGGGTLPAVPQLVCGGLGLAPATRAQDSSVEIEGDDTGIGFDLSLLYELGEATRIGLTYRPGVDFTLEGEADFDQSAACAGNMFCSGALTTLGGDIETDVELPDTITLSVSHQLTDRWTVHGDIARTEWSSIQEVAIVNTGNGRTLSTLELKYDDTMRYALGASYDAGGGHTWRFGTQFDESPQTDAQFVSPRVPDGDRMWLALGYTYQYSEDASIDIGYAHVFVDDIDINSSDGQGHRLQGTFEGAADILGVQANWTF